jgi:protein arginine N-methyltransferase 1
MYSIADYGAMIADEVRMAAFVQALRQTVGRGSVVVDIGTGTGIFALLACQLGARRVYAIEPDDAIQVAREIAAANGYADRIEFIQGLSTDVSLPEQADIIIADIGGVLPWFGRHLPSIADARRRFLAPGGVLIPRRDTVWAAVVDAPDVYERFAGPWSGGRFGLDMTPARRIATNTWNKARVTREQLLGEPRTWATIDYALVEDADVRASLSWAVTREGTAHGIGAGLDRMVGSGVRISNAPDATAAIRPDRIYSTVFFPLSEPVRVAPGDKVIAELAARLVGDDYVWNWNTRVLDQADPERQKAAFTQSTFFGAPFSRARLHKRAASYRPSLNDEGQVARFVLEAMAAGSPLGEIASQMAARFPSRFPRWEAALGYVGELSCQYG